MRIAAVVSSPENASARYRVGAFCDAFAAAGIDIDLLHRERKTWPLFRQIKSLAEYDAVIWQRHLLGPLAGRLLRRSARRLIYDFDDAVYLRPFDSGKPAASRRRLSRFAAMVRAADEAWAGNRHLVDTATGLARGTEARFVPTTIAPTRYRPATHTRKGDGVRLVWIGSRATSGAVVDAQPQLRACGRLRLRLICDAFPDLPGVDLERVTWAAETEATDLATADVGLSWLPRHPWSDGKCGLKTLQYMAAGLPVIGNRVGANRELIAEGETGFLADTPDEFAAAFTRLAENPSLRARLGAAGRRRVAGEYAGPVWGPRLAGWLKGAGRAAA